MKRKSFWKEMAAIVVSCVMSFLVIAFYLSIFVGIPILVLIILFRLAFP